MGIFSMAAKRRAPDADLKNMTPPHTSRRSYRSHTRATHCEVCKNRIDWGSMCEDCRTRLIAPMVSQVAPERRVAAPTPANPVRQSTGGMRVRRSS
jgi:hypothetical protein